MRRLLIIAAVVLTACTPNQVRHWIAWHDSDPEAAVEFAQRPEVVAELATGEHEATSSDGPQFAQELSAQSVRAGDCESYAPLFAAYGLPVATFTRIAWRESGCNHRSFVMDSDDAGGGLLGLNLKGSLGRTWNGWCGLTLGNVTDAETNVRCAAEAYQRMGMSPWR